MKPDGICKRLAMGAAAGLAGTLVIHALRTASEKYLPQTMPPVRRDPGEYMVKKAEGMLDSRKRRRIPKAAEKAGEMVLNLGYGAAAGACYGAFRRQSPSLWRDGVLMGLATWAAGYLGWLPATGLMPALWKQTPLQAAAPAVRHAAFGLVTATAFHALRTRLGSLARK